MTLTLAERETRKHRIFQLRQLGLAQVDIVNLTGINIGCVNEICRQLQEEGKLQKIQSHSMTFLRSRGQRLYQDLKIARILQEAVLPENPVYLVREVAQMLGVPTKLIRRLCSEEIIPCSRSLGKERGNYLLSSDSIEAIKVWLASSVPCSSCGKKLLYQSGTPGRPRTVCDADNCQLVYRQNKLQALLDKPLDVDSFYKEWHLELIRRLNKKPFLDRKPWVGIREASRVSGIKHPLLCYLARRGIFRVRLNKKQKWQNRPTRLFSVTQMEITRRVYAKYHH